MLINHSKIYNEDQSAAMNTFIEAGGVDELDSVANSSTVHHSQASAKEVLDTDHYITDNIEEILTPFDLEDDAQFILVEGAPGMGKSSLLQEIACRWSKEKLMKKIELVLYLRLRDPRIQKMTEYSDFIAQFCMGKHNISDVLSAFNDHLQNTQGKGVVFLFDGFDEFPENLRKNKNHVVISIIDRRVLPKCNIIVSSRPHASTDLPKKPNSQVDILGFNEKQRTMYIEAALQSEPHKIRTHQYLNQHYNIGNLCYIPFFIVVLLYLIEQDSSLPTNSAELYEQFACITICHCLNRFGKKIKNIINLSSLPQPYSQIIGNLSKLSLEGLYEKKLVFTMEEMKVLIPDIESHDGAINGFGLLQAIKHSCPGGETMTFNFIHLCIQEFLAAYHMITHLTYDAELAVLNDNFYNSNFLNVFSIYTAITKGQRPAFKTFLKNGEESAIISSVFLSSQLQCFRLYHAFYEAGDKEVCKSIAQSKTFKNKHIELTEKLTPVDLECLTLFQNRSFYDIWVKMDLAGCFIQDIGVTILHRGLINSGIIIESIGLLDNGITKSSSSLISEIAITCCVKELLLSGNRTIGEEEKFYKMLYDPSSVLEILHISRTDLTNDGAAKCFKALSKGNILKELWVSYNCITDEASGVICSALHENKSLIRFRIRKNKITEEFARDVFKAIHFHENLEELWLPRFPVEIQEEVKSMQDVVNKNRENQGISSILKTRCLN